MEFPPFRLSVETCQTVLNDLGADVDIVHILCSEVSGIIIIPLYLDTIIS